MLIVNVTSVCEEDGQYYAHVFLDECLYEVRILEYDRIYILEEIDVNKANASKECNICHYCFF